MRFALFYHSLVSDWNHGNAHFLRGVARELQHRGHEVRIFEPCDGWSSTSLRNEHGPGPVEEFSEAFPTLESEFYDPLSIDLERALDGIDVVLVHEWNDAALVAKIGRHLQSRRDVVLLFHDTHHRSVTAPEQMRQYDLSHYHGVLAFGDVVRRKYLDEQWSARAWTWHEAADTRLFRPPLERPADAGDLVWIGNWGDGERGRELRRYLIEPVRQLQLRALVHGVRYPKAALRKLAAAGIAYGGWLANYRVPEVFAQFSATVHIPRRPYREQLLGIPTIRVFEALACGIPLICLHWDDCENLFHPGEDYLLVDRPQEMTDALRGVLHEPKLRERLSTSGWHTIQSRHTCAHRVDELLCIIREIRGSGITAARPVSSSPAILAGE